MTSAIKYLDDETIAEEFHKFFENVLSYKIVFNDTVFTDMLQFDNYQFIINELFLYFTAAILKHNRFLLFDRFLIRKYYLTNVRNMLDGVHTYRLLNGSPRSFEIASRDKRRISYTADILIQNAKNRVLLVRDIMQADFILFIRSDITFEKGHNRWYPFTGLYIASGEPEFELFLRAESTKFFNNFKMCLGIENLEQLYTIAKEFEQGLRKSHQYYDETLYPPYFMNLEKLCKSK